MSMRKIKSLGVIPARYASTRFPGKPLALIAGRPMLQWVIEAASQSRELDEVVVATDHQEIYQLAQRLQVRAVMTNPDLATGSDRVWQAVSGEDCVNVINIQGDEPLLKAELLDALVQALAEPGVEMATLGRPMTDEDLLSANTAKIVVNQRDEALYFSRFAIPHSRHIAGSPLDLSLSLKHIGLYGYKKDFLQRFCALGPTALEAAESLEQLRALYLGARIKVVRVNSESWGVDTPQDIAKIERILQQS